jgi:hypothetical protein
VSENAEKEETDNQPQDLLGYFRRSPRYKLVYNPHEHMVDISIITGK